MSSEQAIDGDELHLEVIPETESDEDTQATESFDGEGESKEELNLATDEKGSKPTPAEENAKRQEEAWLNKVISGKANVEDAPKWLHGRLNARLEATTKVPDTEEVVKKVLNQERENAEYKALQQQIPPLTERQATELREKVARFKPLGKTEALRTAMDLMGLSDKIREAEARGVAKGRTSIPVSGFPSVKKSGKVVGGVPLEVVLDDRAWNQMIRQGAGN